jgi:salicylate hydroxylase
MQDVLPDIQTALRRVPEGSWREFAAFAGPELPALTAWSHKLVLVGDSSHALSGAFGSGAGFAMEDGWVLAQALLAIGKNDLHRALPIFEQVRLPYYAKMYAHLESEKQRREERVGKHGLYGVHDDQ